MNATALIPVFTGTLCNEETPLVDARLLHAFLEVDAHFRSWIARRIEEYGFQDGEDFRSFLSESTGGRRSKDYHLTLDMAKELAMVERNEKGKQARRYFIECEKQLHATAPHIASSIMASTIGTDGFHVLGSLVAGKVSALPSLVRRRAKAKLWSQVHAAFNVRRAEDIPADQLDSARNFVAAYVLEGELLEAPRKPDEVVLDEAEIVNLYSLLVAIPAFRDVQKQAEAMLRAARSPLASEMHGAWSETGLAAALLSKLKDRCLAATPERYSLVRKSQSQIATSSVPFGVHVN